MRHEQGLIEMLDIEQVSSERVPLNDGVAYGGVSGLRQRFEGVLFAQDGVQSNAVIEGIVLDPSGEPDTLGAVEGVVVLRR